MARLRREAARMDGIFCVDFSRMRHGLKAVLPSVIAAVIRDGGFRTTAEVTKSRWLKGVSAGVVTQR